MDTFLDDLAKFYGLSTGMTGKLIVTIIVISALWIFRFLIMWLVYHRSESAGRRYVVRKVSFYLCVAITAIVVLLIWFDDLRSLSVATYLGLVSAGIAISLKDLLTNLAGWIYILSRRPFDVGDRVAVGDATGDVIDYNIFEFVLVEIGNWVHGDQSTGRLIFIPNGLLFTKPLYNYTRGFNFIWEDINTTVTFESNWREAKQILESIVNKHTEEFVKLAEEDMKKASSRFFVYYRNLTPIVYTRVVDSGVEFSIRYVVAPRQRRKIAQLIWEEILDEFGARDDIDFAYYTVRTYSNTAEGKENARAPMPFYPPPAPPSGTSPEKMP